MQIAKYLKTWHKEWIILVPDPQKSLEVFDDADFRGDWVTFTSADDPSTVK
jgi:hypothetical protein